MLEYMWAFALAVGLDPRQAIALAMIESGFALLLGLPLGAHRALALAVMVAAASLPGWLMLAFAAWLMLPGELG